MTTVEKLIRDPYWIYARHILRLKPLNSLSPEPDAALRGQVFHRIAEQYVASIRDDSTAITQERFLEVASIVLDDLVPWPATRRLWMGHLTAIAPEFVAEEAARQSWSKNVATEVKGRLELSGSEFVITGEADRIDISTEGSLLVYDYKSGSIPSIKQTKQFNPQILIEAVMAEHAAFEGIDAAVVAEGAYLSLGRSGKSTKIEMRKDVITGRSKASETLDFRVSTTERELTSLLLAYAQAGRGYPSRRAMEKMRFDGDYDHLARFGEWDETEAPTVISVP